MILNKEQAGALYASMRVLSSTLSVLSRVALMPRVEESHIGIIVDVDARTGGVTVLGVDTKGNPGRSQEKYASQHDFAKAYQLEI